MHPAPMAHALPPTSLSSKTKNIDLSPSLTPALQVPAAAAAPSRRDVS